MTIHYGTSAAAAVHALTADAARRRLSERVVAALVFLDTHPGDGRCRRRSYGELGWGMPVRIREDEWLIIWRPGPDGQPYVRYVGPEP